MARVKLQRKTIDNETQVTRPLSITADVIAQRAYALYLNRGSEDGHDVEDWLQAERELRAAIRTPQSQ